MVLLRAAADRGVTTILNATPEPKAARKIVALANILIVNETEATDLLGGQPVTWRDAATSLLEFGPQCVVVSLGKAGAVIVDQNGYVQISAPEVQVIDSTGAGDAFCGAFAAAICSGADRVDAARTGVLAGSLAVTKRGAQPSIPNVAEIESFRNSIQRG